MLIYILEVLKKAVLRLTSVSPASSTEGKSDPNRGCVNINEYFFCSYCMYSGIFWKLINEDYEIGKKGKPITSFPQVSFLWSYFSLGGDACTSQINHCSGISQLYRDSWAVASSSNPNLWYTSDLQITSDLAVPICTLYAHVFLIFKLFH